MDMYASGGPNSPVLWRIGPNEARGGGIYRLYLSKSRDCVRKMCGLAEGQDVCPEPVETVGDRCLRI